MKAKWMPATNGTSKYHWFVVNGDNTAPLNNKYLRDKLGRLRKFKSYLGAQKAINNLQLKGNNND